MLSSIPEREQTWSIPRRLWLHPHGGIVAGSMVVDG
jgi:hypothetical protein